jgi:hypothetical protein
MRSHFRTENRISLFLKMLESMIPNSVQRFSEKIMLKQEARAYS